MDWNDSPEQAAFRAEVRELIDNGLPDGYGNGRGDWPVIPRTPPTPPAWSYSVARQPRRERIGGA